MIALQAKDKTYYVMGLQHLIGFIDGLKEGAAVKVEGYARAMPCAPEYAFLDLTKLTFNGKDYDLSQTPGNGKGGRGMMDCRGSDQGQNGMIGGRGPRGDRN
jgi:hypothetical protein